MIRSEQSHLDQLRGMLRTEANILRTAPGPVRLVDLLLDFGIKLSVADEVSGRADGILRKRNDQWQIILPRAKESPTAARLSDRERFTVAHEIGHFLLFRNGVPPPQSRSEYWQLEELCNVFAGQLLIADFELEQFFPARRSSSATQLLLLTKQLARRLLVSFEVSARRVTEWVVGSALMRAHVISKDRPIVVIQWITESRPWLGAGRGKHLPADHPLTQLVLNQSRRPQMINESAVSLDATVASQRSDRHVDIAAQLAEGSRSD
jgi:IrrE N-terminal-like domain